MPFQARNHFFLLQSVLCVYFQGVLSRTECHVFIVLRPFTRCLCLCHVAARMGWLQRPLAAVLPSDGNSGHWSAMHLPVHG